MRGGGKLRALAEQEFNKCSPIKKIAPELIEVVVRRAGVPRRMGHLGPTKPLRRKKKGLELLRSVKQAPSVKNGDEKPTGGRPKRVRGA